MIFCKTFFLVLTRAQMGYQSSILSIAQVLPLMQPVEETLKLTSFMNDTLQDEFRDSFNVYTLDMRFREEQG